MRDSGFNSGFKILSLLGLQDRRSHLGIVDSLRLQLQDSSRRDSQVWASDLGIVDSSAWLQDSRRRDRAYILSDWSQVSWLQVRYFHGIGRFRCVHGIRFLSVAYFHGIGFSLATNLSKQWRQFVTELFGQILIELLLYTKIL